jgi:hypothetical protein
MGIVPPKQKFKAPHRMLGIAMQAYYVAGQNVASGAFPFPSCKPILRANTPR